MTLAENLLVLVTEDEIGSRFEAQSVTSKEATPQFTQKIISNCFSFFILAYWPIADTFELGSAEH